MNHVQFTPDTQLDQLQCPLFSIVPPEIRNRIFSYALADYEDTARLYENETCYKRPNYFAPRRSDTALLRTCQRIYCEAWFRPWTSKEHTFWLTEGDRCPEGCPLTPSSIEAMLTRLHRLHSVHGATELDRVRVFSQLYMLENGVRLNGILGFRHFNPVCITLTIRHTDWWHWELDAPLRIASHWTNSCRFPESVREVRMELESLGRKKKQIDDIASQMVEKWHFTQRNGDTMCAKESQVTTMTWSGSSIWGGRRWARDESAPETLQYHVATVTWRASKRECVCKRDSNPDLFATNPGTRLAAQRDDALDLSELGRARVPNGTPMEEARTLLTVYRLGLRRRILAVA